MDEPRQLGDGPELGHLADDEPPIADGAVAGDDRPGRQLDEPLDRGRPVEREAVAEERRRIVLQEVAGEEDVCVGDPNDDVVVGVAAAEIGELDRAAARVDLDRRRSPRTSCRGGSRTTSASSCGKVRQA